MIFQCDALFSLHTIFLLNVYTLQNWATDRPFFFFITIGVNLHLTTHMAPSFPFSYDRSQVKPI
uniref:Uncharacterized protein n=1 Tax=Arundo donax TaxID=35708 RepID=A0A0A9HJZ4_ARUDO